MYLILCCSYLNHSLRFVGGKKRIKKKSHIESQSQYFGKKSQLDYFPKSFSPTYHPYTHVPKCMPKYLSFLLLFHSCHHSRFSTVSPPLSPLSLSLSPLVVSLS